MLTFSSTNRQAGAALVEFALVLPVLLILAFGITELGRALYQKNILNKSVEAGVRYLARGYGALDQDCGAGADWDALQMVAKNLVVFGNEAGSGTPLLPGLSTGLVEFSAQSRPVAGGDAACVVIGRARADFNAIFGDSVIPFLDVDLVELSAESEERYIGE